MVVLCYEWYGWDVTCCACGEVWQDGERAERPFRPRWREKNAKAARKLWEEMTDSREGASARASVMAKCKVCGTALERADCPTCDGDDGLGCCWCEGTGWFFLCPACDRFDDA